MSAVEKFLFETDFEIIPEPELIVDEPLPGDELADSAEEEPEEFIPTFSEEEMTAAREQGFSTGKEEALHEAQELVENKILECLRRIDQNITDLFAVQTSANEELPKAGADIAVNIAKKIVPELASRNALGEIERVVQTAIEVILTEPRVTITANSEILEELSERLADMRKGREQEGRVAVIGDDDMDIGDCTLEWGNGGTERNVQNLWREIDEIVERYLEDGSIMARPGEPDDSDMQEAEPASEEQVSEEQDEDTPPEESEQTDETAETAETAETENKD